MADNRSDRAARELLLDRQYLGVLCKYNIHYIYLFFQNRATIAPWFVPSLFT